MRPLNRHSVEEVIQTLDRLQLNVSREQLAYEHWLVLVQSLHVVARAVQQFMLDWGGDDDE